jgi:multicomponent K+:H+ antiporter subunit A
MMPITATLAMVASAAMAGVPLLNGFLSKEMFFAETVFWMPPLGGSCCPWSPPWPACSAWPIRCASPSMCSSAPGHRPAARAARAAALDARAGGAAGAGLPGGGHLPAWSVGRSWLPPRSSGGRHLPEYSLAIWHGWNTPLIMSLVALAGGIVLYLRCAAAPGQLRRPAAAGRSTASASSRTAGPHHLLAGQGAAPVHRRLQWQMLWLVCVALVAALPLWLAA